MQNVYKFKFFIDILDKIYEHEHEYFPNYFLFYSYNFKELKTNFDNQISKKLKNYRNY